MLEAMAAGGLILATVFVWARRGATMALGFAVLVALAAAGAAGLWWAAGAIMA